MSLAANNLTWCAGRTTIIEDITFEVRKGEIFGLVGPNGSGKSTLLLLLAGLRKPTRGEVTFNGVNLAHINRRETAQQIALVAQQLDTTDRLSVRETVELGRTPWLGPITPFGEADRKIVEDALVETGVAHLAERQWQTLSGGERQRAHIARALAQKADYLILDEPTNHLDIHHQLAILALIKRLPITVILALHDLNQAMGCDRIGIMEGGRLEIVGSPEDTLTAERINRIFEVMAHPIIDPVDGKTILKFALPEEKKPTELK